VEAAAGSRTGGMSVLPTPASGRRERPIGNIDGCTHNGIDLWSTMDAASPAVDTYGDAAVGYCLWYALKSMSNRVLATGVGMDNAAPSDSFRNVITGCA